MLFTEGILSIHSGLTLPVDSSASPVALTLPRAEWNLPKQAKKRESIVAPLCRDPSLKSMQLTFENQFTSGFDYSQLDRAQSRFCNRNFNYLDWNLIDE